MEPSASAHVGDVLFWSELAFSLSLGLVAAFPVNVGPVHLGVREGMQNPAEMGGRRSRRAQAAED